MAKDGKGASLVHVNSTTEARTVTIDLSMFRDVSRNATVTPVVTDANGKLEKRDPIKVSDRAATFTVPAQSVTSFVNKGVSGVAKDAPLLRKGHTYTLTGVQSGKAVTAADNGTNLVIRSGAADATTPGQQCQLRSGRSGSGVLDRYVFTNPVAGKRLAVCDGAPVVEPDEGKRDETTQWIMSTTGDGTWTLVNVATHRLLEVGGQATNEGAAVTTWTPNSGSNQRWKVADVTDQAGDATE